MTTSYRDQPPTQLSVDADYDYQGNGPPTTPTPTSNAPRDWQQAQGYDKGPTVDANNHSTTTGEEALLDLVQLEELHQEAERMKALGNKHMAAQEFTRAYNAYSAALQLSPVGPSSHVFLSNRAAALLSLKRYAAAATDAKRAVALAPTFGKAHARLGQALYFQKDYEGAVQAYQDAISYEPDNAVTLTYLEKAKTKWEKQKRKARGEEVSVADTATQFTGHASVVTDVNKTNVVQSGGFRGQSDAVVAAANRAPTTPGSVMPSPPGISDLDIDDPDFEEALKIQQRANRYLANKQYKYAIEEYTAALFLVPDDPQLSPDLHLGRAHALNGSRRHESARNDAQLAIKLAPTPAAYSTLAKSLFYMKDYQGAIDAFAKCTAALPKGESLGMFDKAYLQKAEAALEEASASLSFDNRSRSSKSSAPVPKLKPPRFVPREEAMKQTPNVPSMPKQWPQQIPSSPTSLKCGPEREIVFLSESLGIKLNRGPDGIVRVLYVSPHTAGSPVARDGAIFAGDVVREAAGVDIRRPITNVMWGDTVALIKMAPRPITMMVAKELSEVPPSVLEEQRRASPSKSSVPSPANFDESVADAIKGRSGKNADNEQVLLRKDMLRRPVLRVNRIVALFLLWVTCCWMGSLVLARAEEADATDVTSAASAGTNNGPLRVLTPDELRMANGVDSDNLYLCLFGRVYDVAEGAEYYKPDGGPYHIFTARDAPVPFVTGVFDDEEAAKPWDAVEPNQHASYLSWVDFYEGEAKYPLVGVVQGTFYDEEGKPTAERLRLLEALEVARKEQERKTAERQKKIEERKRKIQEQKMKAKTEL